MQNRARRRGSDRIGEHGLEAAHGVAADRDAAERTAGEQRQVQEQIRQSERRGGKDASESEGPMRAGARGARRSSYITGEVLPIIGGVTEDA